MDVLFPNTLTYRQYKVIPTLIKSPKRLSYANEAV